MASSTPRQISPGISFLGYSTSLTIQPVDLIVQGMDLLESFLIRIINYPADKLNNINLLT